MSTAHVRLRVRALSTLGALALASIIIAGCSASDEASTANPSPSTSASPEKSGSGADGSGQDERGETPGASGPTAAPDLPITDAALDEQASLSTGMSVEITSVTPTEVTASTPGEVSGTAVEVEVVVTNGSEETQDVSSAVVTLSADDGEYGIPTIAGGPSPLSGPVEPGETARGTYMFMLAPAEGREITVLVNYSAGEPVARFSGRTA